MSKPIKLRANPETVARLADRIEGYKAAYGRTCGACSMCCYLLDIEDSELNKPGNQWCQHCKPGHHGCTIHATRPAVCRSFACGWLLGPELGDHWYPKRCHMVVHGQYGGLNAGADNLWITVDPRHANIWRTEPYRTELAQNSLKLLSASRQIVTRVAVGDTRYVICGPKDYRDSKGGIFLHVGPPHQWEYLDMPSQEAADELHKKLHGFAEQLSNPKIRAQVRGELAAIAGRLPVGSPVRQSITASLGQNLVEKFFDLKGGRHG